MLHYYQHHQRNWKHLLPFPAQRNDDSAFVASLPAEKEI
jgi:hypothetical protein